jgi:putative acetyltransferase
MIVRPERPFDYEAIDVVVREAFDSPGDPEVLMVRRIREHDGYLPSLALVADDEGEIVGHIMLSYVGLGPHNVLQLAPLSVRPSHQNRGIGEALTRDALMRADEALEPLVIVLGHPNYYPRFGFEPAKQLGIEPPDDAIPDEAWMAKRLSSYDPSLRGVVDFGPVV